MSVKVQIFIKIIQLVKNIAIILKIGIVPYVKKKKKMINVLLYITNKVNIMFIYLKIVNIQKNMEVVKNLMEKTKM